MSGARQDGRREVAWGVAGAAAVLAFGAVLYWPVIGFAYAWDDFLLFGHSTALRDGTIQWADVATPVLPDSTYFRPLALWTFAVQFQWLGLWPMWAHAVSLSLYLVNILLVAALTAAYVRRLELAGLAWRVPLAALLYALHPALVESTAWVSGRFDQMVTLFVLAALLADACIERPWLRAGVIAGCFALGLGSKELAITLPALLVLQRLALDRESAGLAQGAARAIAHRAHWPTWFACVLVLIAYFAIRPHGFEQSLSGMQAVESGFTTLAARGAWVMQTVAFYLYQSLMPLMGTPGPSHPADPTAVYSTASLVNAGVGAAVCVGIALATLSRRSSQGWLLGMWLASLALVLHIVPVPMADNWGFDRFLTLPLTFMAIAASLTRMHVAALRPSLFRGVAVLGVALWSALAAANVAITVPMWQNDLRLWTWSHDANPESRVSRNNYVTALIRENQPAQALPVLEELIQNGNAGLEHRINYGYALIGAGRVEEGVVELQQLLPPLTTDPGVPALEASAIESKELMQAMAVGYRGLAEGYLRLGQAVPANRAIEQALSLGLNNELAFQLQSITLEVLGQVDAAERAQSQALSIAIPEAHAPLRRRREALLVEYRAAVQRSGEDGS